jgi:phosphoglycolate phosphatase-like HAD superfamily hydrolase
LLRLFLLFIIEETKMAKTRIKLIVSDMDGTRSSYWDGAVPAWREQLPRIADLAGITVNELGRQMGRVIHHYGTHDYPWILECCSFAKTWQGDPERFHREVSKPYWEAMDTYRQQYVRLYNGVEETDAALAELGISVVILSDSPFHIGRIRAIEAENRRKLAVGRVSGFYALALKPPEPGHLFDPGALHFGEERVNTLNSIPAPENWKECELPWDSEKPDPKGIKRIMQDWNVERTEIIVIGDSLFKDGGLAANISSRFIHTPSGMVSSLPTEYRQMVEEVLIDPSRVPRSLPQLKRAIPTIAVASDYGEILNHLYVEKSVHEAQFPE